MTTLAKHTDWSLPRTSFKRFTLLYRHKRCRICKGIVLVELLIVMNTFKSSNGILSSIIWRTVLSMASKNSSSSISLYDSASFLRGRNANACDASELDAGASIHTPQSLDIGAVLTIHCIASVHGSHHCDESDNRAYSEASSCRFVLAYKECKRRSHWFSEQHANGYDMKIHWLKMSHEKLIAQMIFTVRSACSLISFWA